MFTSFREEGGSNTLTPLNAGYGHVYNYHSYIKKRKINPTRLISIKNIMFSRKCLCSIKYSISPSKCISLYSIVGHCIAAQQPVTPTGDVAMQSQHYCFPPRN